jgi:hypothetical protein
MMPIKPPASPMFLIFRREVAGAAVDQDDLAGQRAGQERIAAQQIAARAVAVLDRCLR